MGADGEDDPREVLVEAFGAAQADEVLRALDVCGLVAVDVAELAQLRRTAAAYGRLARLVEGPTVPEV